MEHYVKWNSYVDRYVMLETLVTFDDDQIFQPRVDYLPVHFRYILKCSVSTCRFYNYFLSL